MSTDFLFSGSLVAFSLLLLLFTLYAVLFLGARRLRKTHLDALGADWSGQTPRAQVLYVVLLRELGAGWLGTVVAVGWLLGEPVLSRQAWGGWAIASLVSAQAVPLLFALLKIERAIGSRTQWYMPLVAIALALAGAIQLQLSLQV